jgi:hypothetical protein
VCKQLCKKTANKCERSCAPGGKCQKKDE